MIMSVLVLGFLLSSDYCHAGGASSKGEKIDPQEESTLVKKQTTSQLIRPKIKELEKKVQEGSEDTEILKKAYQDYLKLHKEEASDYLYSSMSGNDISKFPGYISYCKNQERLDSIKKILYPKG